MVIQRRKVRCNVCNNEFMSIKPDGRIRCTCGSYDVSIIETPEDQETTKETSPFRRPQKELRTSKQVDLKPENLAVIKKLVDAGVYNDMDEALNKSVEAISMLTENTKFMNYLLGGKVNMPEENLDPKKEMDRMQLQDLFDAQIQKKKAESAAMMEKVKTGTASPQELLSTMKEMLALKQYAKMMKDLEKDEDNKSSPLAEMKEMMMMQVYSNMMLGGHSKKSNGETLELQRKVDDLQKELQNQKILDEIKKISQSTNNKGISPEDYLKIFADKQVAIEKERSNTEKAKQEALSEREKRLDFEKQTDQEKIFGVIEDLHKKLENKKTGAEEAKHIKEQIESYKEIAEMFGGSKETSKGDLAVKLIQGTMDKLGGPIAQFLQEKSQERAERRARESQYPMPQRGQSYAPMTPMPQPELEAPLQEVAPSEVPMPMRPEDQIIATMDSQNTIKTGR